MPYQINVGEQKYKQHRKQNSALEHIGNQKKNKNKNKNKTKVLKIIFFCHFFPQYYQRLNISTLATPGHPTRGPRAACGPQGNLRCGRRRPAVLSYIFVEIIKQL